MANLFASLTSSAGALDAFQRSLDVTQNNVNNASTPGYAKQRLSLEALPFQPAAGLEGGVQAGALESARNQYADNDVRQKLQALGYFDQQLTSLSAIESGFDISGTSGVNAALNNLFQSFSAWSADANNPSLRQAVLDRAGALAQAFQSATGALAKNATSAEQQIRQTVGQVNDLTAKLRSYNQQRLAAGTPDAGLDAKMQSTLEDLSQLVNFDTVQQPDGSVSVLLDGQTPLVIGDKQYALSADLSTPGSARIVSADGREITSQVSQGSLGALLETRNQFLPSVADDLNRLAKSVGDRVNQILTSGQASAGPPPQNGLPLFDTTGGTLKVNPNITAAQLAAIDPGPPYAGNGAALKLANLADSTDSADQIDGLTYVAFYGALGGRVGGKAATAQDNLDIQKQVAAQARSLRDQISGVSLDEEAVHLIEFQRAYQATAKMVSVLDDLTQVTINLVR